MFDKEKFHKALLKRNVLWPAELLNVTDSTNTQAFNYLAQGRGPIMVLARRQTAGRGTKVEHGSAHPKEPLLSLGFNTQYIPRSWLI
jgi:phosphoribosylamine-glycine ligase